MNLSYLKNPVGIACVTLAFLGLVAAIVIITIDGISPASFVQSVVTIVTGIALALGIGQVQRQTNGTLSARDAKIDQLTTAIATLLPHVDADVAASATAALTPPAKAVEATPAPDLPVDPNAPVIQADGTVTTPTDTTPTNG